ncbi:glutamic acid-rich protein-like isoform X2 [Leucoraja erinacea]|uniref:glutamic acid-rich protein-like isoform X2 n=1 Tax=Leucoraja erinaceus TaxID=7782 RepID=UPI0024580B94|nr:glutamic acid-rich protein-like isoform X2 [Leucoraja erinacea]
MWSCICGNGKPRASEGALCCQSSQGKYLVADLAEQVAQYEQLVVQLQNDLQDKEAQLYMRDEQLKVLEDAEKKLREKDEALLETTQHVDVLQRELDEKDRELAEMVEDARKLEDKNEDLDNECYAEDYASHIKICGLRATHKADLTNLKGKHSTQLCKIREKHAHKKHHRKISAVYNFTNKKLLAENYASHTKVRDLKECHLADLTNLKEQARLLSQDAEGSEDRSLAIEALFQTKIEQIQEKLDNVQLVSAQKLLLEHEDVEIDNEEEDDQLHLNVNWPQCVEAENENLQTIAEEREDQYQLVSAQKLLLEHEDVEIDNEEEDDQLHLNVNWPQCVEAENENLQTIAEEREDQYQLVSAQKLLLEHEDVEIDNEEEDDQLHLNVNWPQCVEAENENLQTIAEEREDQYQISDSESEEELVKWQEMVSKSTPSHADWRIAMHLRVNQVEEKREELPELEEEVGDLQRQGQLQGWTKQTTAGQSLMENEELEATQQERTEQDPSSSKRELAELRPARRKYTTSLDSIEQCEAALEIDPSEEVVVTRKVCIAHQFFVF